MFDKTYLLSPQGQADYKAWIKKLTDIAAKEAGVSATVDNDGEPVLMLIRGRDHVPEKLRDKNANLYVIKVTIEIKDILMRELEEVEATTLTGFPCSKIFCASCPSTRFQVPSFWN